MSLNTAKNRRRRASLSRFVGGQWTVIKGKSTGRGVNESHSYTTTSTGILKAGSGIVSIGFVLAALLLLSPLNAQVYSPWVLKEGQPDTRDLVRLTETLYENAGAHTDREKAEAIWRYLLTDGRFVEPGVFYHIAGWAYEEPMGEVLDPTKLLNSYGFGLCYQVAPLLEALWEAGGFIDARTWFLTGHTVAEVYFDGKYNMLDSDMLGFTTVGDADPSASPIASVRELEEDERIILGKMLAQDEADSSKVADPWYPADVREKAMGGYAEIFTSRDDNWLFYFRRFPAGHTLDYVLRPGEKLIRYFEPEDEGLFYLPFKREESSVREFPQEKERWEIRTEDGPHSQKDSRLWATGRVEYIPPLDQVEAYYPLFSQNLRLPSGRNGDLERQDPSLPAAAVFEMPSPYVLIDAEFRIGAALSGPAHRLAVETSVDAGESWRHAGALTGPYSGPWKIGPEVLTNSAHGALSAVSGKYGYLVRLTLSGPASGTVLINNLKLSSVIQVNPRTLPELETGENKLFFSPGTQRKRWSVPIDLSRIDEFALSTDSIQYVEEDSNGLLLPEKLENGEVIFELSAPDSSPLKGLLAGGRFLVLGELAPEKLTAETRKTALEKSPPIVEASLSWALSPEGPWHPVWKYDPPSNWLDKWPVDRLLLWPEVDEHISDLPRETKRVYVRYLLNGMALDEVRLATFTPADSRTSLVVTHNWFSRGSKLSHSQEIKQLNRPFDYMVNTGPFAEVRNLSIVFECPSN